MSKPSPNLRIAQRHAARMGRKPRPPAHGVHLPICQQSAEVEEAWWARVFAERGIPDPAHGAQSVLPCLTKGAQAGPPEADSDYWDFVMGSEAEALALSESSMGRTA